MYSFHAGFNQSGNSAVNISSICALKTGLSRRIEDTDIGQNRGANKRFERGFDGEVDVSAQELREFDIHRVEIKQAWPRFAQEVGLGKAASGSIISAVSPASYYRFAMPLR